MNATNILNLLADGGLPKERREYLETAFSKLTVVDAEEVDRWARYKAASRERTVEGVAGHA